MVTQAEWLCLASVLAAWLKSKVCHLPCTHLPAIHPTHTTHNLSPPNHRVLLCSQVHMIWSSYPTPIPVNSSR